MFDKVRDIAIRESLNIESFFFRIERSQISCSGHVSRMRQKRLPKQILFTEVNGKRSYGPPRTRWLDYNKETV